MTPESPAAQVRLADQHVSGIGGSNPDPVVPGAAQAIPERRQHPAYLVIGAGRAARALIPAIALVLLSAPWWALAALGLAVVVGSFASWRMFRYSVSEGVLRVRSGVFTRTVHTVPIARITALDAQRGVVQRVFGVWGLKVQTPGDSQSSVDLACLTTNRLEELRTALARTPANPAVATEGEPDPAVGTGDAGAPPTTLAILDTRTLLIAAVTGTSVPLIFAGGAAGWNRLTDVLPDRTRLWLEHELFDRASGSVLILAGIAVLAVIVGVLLTSLRLARFTLTRDGDRLRTSRGLISQRTGTIAAQRVQAVRIVEGLWRRLFGWCALEVEVSGLAQSDDTERMLFPLIRRSEADELINRALPELGWHPSALTPVPARARRRYLTMPVVISLLMALTLFQLPGWWALPAVLPLPLALLVGFGQARDAAWHFDERVVVLRWRRLLARHTVIARSSRVQIVRRTVTPLQARAGLAGVQISLSSRRSARVRHLDSANADLIVRATGGHRARRRTGC